MKKTFKRLGAALLAMAMAVSVLCTGALAANTAQNGPFTITVKNETGGYTYAAYQVFKGNLATDESNKKILSNIQWGDGVDSSKTDDLLNAIKDIKGTDSSKPFESCTDAASVATILSDSTKATADVVKEFAKVVGGYLSSTDQGATNTLVSANTSTCTHTDGKDKNHYDISVNDAGYYLVKNTAVPSSADNTYTAYTDYILEVVGNVAVEPKTSTPTVVKKIVKNNTETDAITSSVGNQVTFRLTATLPEKYNDYQQYKLVFHDTLSEGLTYNGDVKVYQQLKNGERTAIDSSKYTVTTTGNTDNCNLQVTFADLKQVVANRETADTIIVEYTATLNEKASLDKDNGNTNKVTLEYSNDPNYTTKPDTTEPTGKTPESEVKVYTTGLKLTKIDGTTKKSLSGAKFKISGLTNQVLIINNEIYKESENGTYYMLKDGTYTTTEPNDSNKNSYDSTQKYEKITTVTKDTAPQTQFEAEAYVDSDGVLKITGLGEGTYTITELKAPDGYNLLQEPITITISANATKDGCTWTVKNGETNLTTDNTDTTLYAFNVENNAGSQLPSTGGMGTTLFYIIGGVLMAGAAVVLVIKKKRSSAE